MLKTAAKKWPEEDATPDTLCRPGSEHCWKFCEGDRQPLEVSQCPGRAEEQAQREERSRPGAHQHILAWPHKTLKKSAVIRSSGMAQKGMSFPGYLASRAWERFGIATEDGQAPGLLNGCGSHHGEAPRHGEARGAVIGRPRRRPRC